jgi:hypothetical protein
MWYLNVIKRMVPEYCSLSDKQLIYLEQNLFLFTTYYENLAVEENTIKIKLINMGALCYLLDGMQRRLAILRDSNDIIKIDNIIDIFITSLIVAVKMNSEYRIFIKTFVPKEEIPKWACDEWEHLKILNFQLEIPDNRMGAFFKYLTTEEDRAEFLKDLKEHDESDTLKRKFQDYTFKRSIISNIHNLFSRFKMAAAESFHVDSFKIR